MTLRRSTPLPFSPTGLSDTLDGSNVFKGAMASLKNLIPDPTTKNLWQCRPASILEVNFSTTGGAFSSAFSSAFATGFAINPGFISCKIEIGTRTYGMIATDTFTGHDEPFCYDHVTGLFAIISGATSPNTPISPPSSGTWTPPTMTVVGVYIIITHPGYTGAGNVMFGYINISDPAAPVYGGTNTAPTALVAPPVAAKGFNDRCYFAVNPPTGQPGLYYSDILAPLTVTNGTQVLTFDDNIALTALGALPLNTQFGGKIQALIVFKGITNAYQVTGDAASTSNPLAKNSLNVATGTLAPNSICSTPKGLAFMAPDGVRLIDFSATISDPIGDAGNGVAVPFKYATVPSRVAAACNATVFRITVQNGYATDSPVQEYWYDIPRACWSGPHDFPASLIGVYNNTFIIAPVDVEGALYVGDGAQNSTSTFEENDTQMTFNWQTSMLPDTQQMSENAIIESTINIALAAGEDVVVTAGDENGAVFGTSTIEAPAQTTVWGGFIWGAALWQGATNALAPRQMDWPEPIVFRRLYISAIGNSAAGVRFGDMFLRYEQLGYLQQRSYG